MLYHCPCITFCPAKNNYRKLYSDYIILYGSAIITNIRKGLCILIFEGGGLHDEYKIIKEIIKSNINKILIDIIVIDSIENDQMLAAQDHFQSLLLQKANTITFTSSLSLRHIDWRQYDSVIILSIDPYYFLIDNTFKSMINDILSLTSFCSFINLSILYLAKNTVTWDMTMYNKIIYSDHIIWSHMIGIKNNFYTQEQKTHQT